MYSRALRHGVRCVPAGGRRKGKRSIKEGGKKSEGGNVREQRSALDRLQLRAITTGLRVCIEERGVSRPVYLGRSTPRPPFINLLLRINQSARGTLTQLQVIRRQIRIYCEPANFRVLDFIRLYKRDNTCVILSTFLRSAGRLTTRSLTSHCSLFYNVTRHDRIYAISLSSLPLHPSALPSSPLFTRLRGVHK